MKRSPLRSATLVIISLLLLSLSALAQDAPAQPAQRERRVGTPDAQPTPPLDAKRADEAARKSEDAARVFNRIMHGRDNAIPKELIDRAEAIAVFPGVLKAGFIVGGRGGSGLISRRVRGGWSPPAFFTLRGGSIGPQIGASKTDFVLLFMNEGAMQGLLEDKFEMGGEASAAAGPIGRAASATTNLTLDAGILSYSRSKGLFAGLELKGAVVNPDNKLNEAIYGQKADKILMNVDRVDLSKVPEVVRIFPVTLARYSRK